MLEIEQKFANVDFALLEKKLAAWGVNQWQERIESDHYLNAPDRDFAQTNEAFRLRRVGENNHLTYKGPRLDPDVKIRTEHEFPIQPGDQAAEDMLKLFDHLGYKRVAVVRKHRRQASFEREGKSFTICLDEVDEVGQFAELEIVAPEAEVDQARALLVTILEELGLEEVERRSYLTMYLANQAPDEQRDIPGR